MASLSKNFDFNLRRDHQKTSYERRHYESVDEPVIGYVPKNYEKNNSGSKGLMCSVYVYLIIHPRHLAIHIVIDS